MSRSSSQSCDANPVATGVTARVVIPPTQPDPFLSVIPGEDRIRPFIEENEQLDRFLIKRHLGSGSLGDVYLAHDSVRAHDVAIKVVDIGPCNSESVGRQLQHEQGLYDQIQDHRHVLKAYDLHQVPWGGTALLILSMEYADGGSFRQWLHDHREDHQTRRTEGLGHFRQICLGVEACHKAGVINCDVKPDNILFVQGQVKIADLGLSFIVNRLMAGRYSPLRRQENDDDGGTPAYMSPEHYTCMDHDDLDARSDVYSLGIILFEILSANCHPPFRGSYRRMRELHTQVQAPSLPDVSEREAGVVKRCLEKEPIRRYQCVGDLLDDLEGRDCGRLGGDGDEPIDNAHGSWPQACDCIEWRRFDEASRLCRLVLDEKPEHDDAKRLLQQLEERDTRARQLYSTIERGMDGSSYGLDELSELLLEAIETYPDHPAGHVVQVRLDLRAKQYRAAMEEGVSCVQDGEWESALEWFQRARQLNPGGSEADRSGRTVGRILEEVRDARRRIDDAISAGDCDRALAEARGIDRYTDQVRNAVGFAAAGDRA